MVNSSQFASDPRIDKPCGSTLREKLPRSVRLWYVNWGSNSISNRIPITAPKPKYGSCGLLWRKKSASNGVPKPETQFGYESSGNPKMPHSLSSTQKISAVPPNCFPERGKQRSGVRSSAPPRLLIRAATCGCQSSHLGRLLAPCLLVRASECAVQSRALAPTIGKASPAARSARSFAGMDIAPSLADPPVGRPTQEQEASPQGEGLLLLDCCKDHRGVRP